MTFETVTSEFPAFVKVTLNVPLFPTATLPKLMLEVLAERIDVAATAVPLKVTMLGVLETSLATEIWPVNAPAALGVKTTSKVDCLPAAIARGKLTPLIVTPAAVALALVMVRLDPPPFDMVTDCDAVLPMDTDPKLMDAGARDMLAALGALGWLDAGFAAPVNPMHPAPEIAAKSKSKSDANEMALLP